MKTIVKHKFVIAATVACMVILFTSCDYLVKNYEFDDNPNGVRNRTLLEHFENNYDKSCTMYCQAIRIAGLQEEIEIGGMTCVVPNNTAFSSFLASVGVTSLEEMNPVLLRSLMLYLIFPGDFRAVTMTPDENYHCESLSGDPIFIKRFPSNTDKYRIVINDNSEELASSIVTVMQQDYMFKNQVVAQVVPEFIIFKPKVEVTEEKPKDYENPNAATATLTVTDDCSIYQGGAGTVYNNSSSGIQVVARSGQVRHGLFKFPLTDINFKEDIVSATLVTRVNNVAGYSIGEDCILQFREFPYSGWVETKATWTNIRGSYANPIARAPVVINSTSFRAISLTAADWVTTPVYVRTDITSSINKYYMGDSTQISLLVEDMSANRTAAGTQIQLCDKDNKGHYTTIELIGPFPSALTLVRNNPVIVSENVVSLDPDNHFAMGGPSVPDDYHYTDPNIIYAVKSAPTDGILTLYGLPMSVNSRFTQAEMRAGVVKYLRTTGTSDSFTLKVFDYLGGLYASDLIVTVQ